jgi:nitroreductase
MSYENAEEIKRRYHELAEALSLPEEIDAERHAAIVATARNLRDWYRRDPTFVPDRSAAIRLSVEAARRLAIRECADVVDGMLRSPLSHSEYQLVEAARNLILMKLQEQKT